MTQAKKTPATAPKAPKKLIPRPAPKADAPVADAEPVVLAVPTPEVAPVVPAAEAVQPAAKADKEAKPEKPAKPKKVKLVRDSYAMPEAEYAQIAVLKKRLAAQKQPVRKSELLRAGIAILSAFNDEELAVVMSHVERVKTGRPRK